MSGSQLVEKLVLDAKALGSLETRKDLAAETMKRLSDEASGVKQIIADLIREKKSLRGQKASVLTGHLRARQKWLRSVNEERRSVLEKTRIIKRRMDLLNERVARLRERLNSEN